MIAPRKYVHLLLILSELMLIAASLMMIVRKFQNPSPDWDHWVWMGSKILTLKKLLQENNNSTFPILEISKDTKSNILYNKNYEYLLKHSGEKCEENFKKCGILDTLGNIMCIPKEDECPVNDLLIDTKNNNDSLLASEYNISYSDYLDKNNLALYYSNKATEQKITTELVFNKPTHYYINKHNFIFDKDAYDDYEASKNSGGDYDSGDWGGDWGGGDWGGGDWGGGDWGGGDIGGGGGGFRRLIEEKKVKEKKYKSADDDDEIDDSEYGDSYVTGYIKKKFKESINIDKTYRNISDNVYARYYLGFKDYETMNQFTNADLYNLYFISFPNTTSNIFCFALIIVLIALIIFSITRFCHKDVPNEGYNREAVLCGKLYIIIPYLIFFIGFYVYIVYEYIKIYIQREHDEIINMKVDPFLEDLLKEIYDRNPKEIYVLIIVILYTTSMVIFLLAWILSHHFTKQYLSLMEKSTQLIKN